MSRQQLVPVNFQSRTSAPTLPTLSAGDTYWNSALGLMTYTGSSWQQANAVSNIDGGTANTVSYELVIDGGSA